MIEQKWIDDYPYLYGKTAIDTDNGHGEIPLNDALVKQLESIEGFGSLFNCWSERHAFITGYTIGMTLSQMENVPVPEFWYSEAHYFHSGVAIGFMSRSVDPAVLAMIITATVKK